MSILEMPNPMDVLHEAVAGTVFDTPERVGPLMQDIHALLQSLGGDVKAGNLTKTVRQGVYFLRTSHHRRDVIADFFDFYPEDATVAEILKAMEHV